MRTLKVLMVLAIAVCLVSSATAADKKKKKGKPVRGSIVSVKQDEGKETGTITVKVAGKKKDAAEAKEMTFTISAATKIENVIGKPKDGKTSAGKFSDLAAGKRVVITAEGNIAETVKVLGGKKKKKKKDTN